MSRRLYVESNFVLEMVFDQDEWSHCEDPLGLDASLIEIVLPNIVVLEARQTFERRLRDFKEQLRQARELAKVARRTPIADDAKQLTELANVLATRFMNGLESRWAEVTQRLDGRCRMCAVSFGCATRPADLPLDSPDFILALAIEEDLRARPPGQGTEVGVASRDKEFAKWAKASLGCAAFERFDAALGWARRPPEGDDAPAS